MSREFEVVESMPAKHQGIRGVHRSPFLIALAATIDGDGAIKVPLNGKLRAHVDAGVRTDLKRAYGLKLTSTQVGDDLYMKAVRP